VITGNLYRNRLYILQLCVYAGSCHVKFHRLTLQAGVHLRALEILYKGTVPRHLRAKFQRLSSSKPSFCGHGLSQEGIAVMGARPWCPSMVSTSGFCPWWPSVDGS